MEMHHCYKSLKRKNYDHNEWNTFEIYPTTAGGDLEGTGGRSPKV